MVFYTVFLQADKTLSLCFCICFLFHAQSIAQLKFCRNIFKLEALQHFKISNILTVRFWTLIFEKELKL